MEGNHDKPKKGVFLIDLLYVGKIILVGAQLIEQDL